MKWASTFLEDRYQDILLWKHTPAFVQASMAKVSLSATVTEDRDYFRHGPQYKEQSAPSCSGWLWSFTTAWYNRRTGTVWLEYGEEYAEPERYGDQELYEDLFPRLDQKSQTRSYTKIIGFLWTKQMAGKRRETSIELIISHHGDCWSRLRPGQF